MAIKLSPLNVSRGVWYYERKGSIEVIVNPLPDEVDAPRKNGVFYRRGNCLMIRIPARLLRETIKRQAGKA